jgi:hypothetical protein
MGPDGISGVHGDETLGEPEMAAGPSSPPAPQDGPVHAAGIGGRFVTSAMGPVTPGVCLARRTSDCVTPPFPYYGSGSMHRKVNIPAIARPVDEGLRLGGDAGLSRPRRSGSEAFTRGN